MKNLPAFCLALFSALLIGCSNSPYGETVKEPFSGSKYESNKKYWRAVGKGESSKDNIAESKATNDALRKLAQQVQTRMKIVTDNFLAETETANSSELNDKFQQLAREVTNTQMADLRRIDEKKMYNGESYTVFVAYEIHKKQMLRFMKKKAKADAKLDAAMQRSIEAIIDQELSEIEE